MRPGRIDSKFELKECNDEQIVKMLRSFISKRSKISIHGRNIKSIDHEELDKKIKMFVKYLCDENGQSKIKPCNLQFYILKYIENVDDIFKNVDELRDIDN